MSYPPPTPKQRANVAERERLHAAAALIPTSQLRERLDELSSRLLDHEEERAGYHVEDRLRWRREIRAIRVVLVERFAMEPTSPEERAARSRRENALTIREQIDAQRPTGADALADIGRAKMDSFEIHERAEEEIGDYGA